MDPFVGEVRMCGFNFAPQGWAFCDGSLLPISEFDALYTLIGTTYGGDGTNYFALPDLRGRIPMHQANQYILGEQVGVETVTLNTNQIPQHTHLLVGLSSTGTVTVPTSSTLLATAPSGLGNAYGMNPTGQLRNSTIGQTGNNESHSNIAPYLAVNFIISLFGIFPSQS